MDGLMDVFILAGIVLEFRGCVLARFLDRRRTAGLVVVFVRGLVDGDSGRLVEFLCRFGMGVLFRFRFAGQCGRSGLRAFTDLERTDGSLSFVLV